MEFVATLQEMGWWADAGARAAAVLAGAILVALLVDLAFRRVVLRAVGFTSTTLDDQLVDRVHRPIAVTIVLFGAYEAVRVLDPSGRTVEIAGNVLNTVGVFVWIRALMDLGQIIIRHAEGEGRYRVLKPRTRPVFQMLLRGLIIGSGIYFLFLAWGIDVTAWLASAGIVGLAVGFAAQDTLANLFAGVFIIADAPYQLGDVLMLESGERGVVTRIGFRSTRLLTPDQVEIIVPNAQMANATVRNECGGPSPRLRLSCSVQAAYGADLDVVRGVLLAATEGEEGIERGGGLAPRARFVNFGDSGLDFELTVWLKHPSVREDTLDSINSKIYAGMNAAGLEIPFPKQDVYMTQIAEAAQSTLEQSDA